MSFASNSRAVAIFVATAGFLSAATAVPDSPAAADVAVNTCGPVIKSINKHGTNAPFTTDATSFVNIPGAKVTVNVPAGKIQCYRVRFSAVISCTGTDVSCYIRPNVVGGLPFSGAAYTSSDKFGAHSFEWFNRVVEGSYPVQMQVETNGTSLTVVSWNLSVEITD
ncbi:MAG TPA: hypothetical protein VL198_06910 [Pseudolabrys sp.]|nr:hypothetical protein [Pseudolabrys sp.]